MNKSTIPLVLAAVAGVVAVLGTTGNLNTVLPNTHQVSYSVGPNIDAVTMKDLKLEDHMLVSGERINFGKKELTHDAERIFVQVEIPDIPADFKPDVVTVGAGVHITAAIARTLKTPGYVIDLNYAVFPNAGGGSRATVTVAVRESGTKPPVATDDGRFMPSLSDAQ